MSGLPFPLVHICIWRRISWSSWVSIDISCLLQQPPWWLELWFVHIILLTAVSPNPVKPRLLNYPVKHNLIKQFVSPPCRVNVLLWILLHSFYLLHLLSLHPSEQADTPGIQVCSSPVSCPRVAVVQLCSIALIFNHNSLLVQSQRINSSADLPALSAAFLTTAEQDFGGAIKLNPQF